MKVLALLSGGIDSPVAIHLLQKQGCEVGAVHFHSYPLTDRASIEKAKLLSAALGVNRLFIIPLADAQSILSQQCRHELYFVLQKRMMLRIAEQLALKHSCDALCTGENLGQVSSQTLHNLVAITQAVKVPVLRPVLCNDKEEIISIAKQIGTFELSKGPEICDLLGPRHPATRAHTEKVLQEEARVDIKGMIEAAMNSLETFTPRTQNS
ncbi:7-cyano-7-deazaguanine synthase [Candidatus Woesearchaeota archaeon]|nr:7-cyano-7-deazaguanine synthase [Candidatus Woesearchaeota archaeon]